MKKMIIDCDTGIDDALAIAYILSHPDIDFVYLRGNHDEAGFVDDGEVIENLKMFQSSSRTKQESL